MQLANPIRFSQTYWNHAAESYERDFAATTVGKLWRESVWRDLDRVFHPGDHVLELNCGTGIDAVRLAEKGVSVLGCDISARMIQLARQRAGKSRVAGRLSFHVIPTEHLDILEPAEKFDGSFSNFSGLNCVEDLAGAGKGLARLLKPGAPAILCFLGRLPLWEIAWFLFHGKPRTAFRALCSGEPAATKGVEVHYLSRQEIVKALSPEFRLRRWKGVGIAIPPSYMEAWASRFPKLTKVSSKMDCAIERWPIFRSIGGCMLLEFERAA